MSRSIITAAVVLTVIAFMAAPCGAEERMSFDSPGVMDLSGYLERSGLSLRDYVPIKTDRMNPDDAWRMIETPEMRCKYRNVVVFSGKLNSKIEKNPIAADGKTVRRVGKSLIIKPASGPPVTFKDWSIPATDQAEGDTRNFIYLGKMAHNGFYRVEALYDHDSPGSFFISPRNGRIVYAHNSTHTTAVSPDGKHMIVLKDNHNAPFGLVVANLSHDEPAVELYCRCSSISPPVNIASVFRGWHVPPHTGFSLFVIMRRPASDATSTFETTPLEFSLQGDGWHLSALNVAELERTTGLRCYQKPASAR